MNDLSSHIKIYYETQFLSNPFLSYNGCYNANYRKYLRENTRKIFDAPQIIYSKYLDEVEWLTKQMKN